ncbi:MAG: hypothetical protein WCP85_17835 [Mariniphaga sp.]
MIKNDNKQVLGSFEERIAANKNLGLKASHHGGGLEGALIDQVHRAMMLYKSANRKELLHYIGQTASSPDGSFWRVVTSLCEILPSG